MKYKLIKGARPHMTTYGGETYSFDTETFREYPQALLSLYSKVLEAEPAPKTKTEEK